jgi:multidrug resistance efflux pump
LTFKQLALLAFACVAAVSGSGYGYYRWSTGRFIESTDDAYVGGNDEAAAAVAQVQADLQSARLNLGYAKAAG